MKQIAYEVFDRAFLQVRRKMDGFLLGVFSDLKKGTSNANHPLVNRKEL